MSEVRQQYRVMQVVHCATPENKCTYPMMYTITHRRGYHSNIILGSHRLGGKENWGETIERRVNPAPPQGSITTHPTAVHLPDRNDFLEREKLMIQERTRGNLVE